MLQTDLYSFSYKKGSLLPICKRCSAENFYKNGKNKQGIQRYLCKECGFRFVWTSDLPRRNYFSNIISFAVEIYTSPRMCASLRGVAIILKKAFGVLVSHQTIRQWVLDAKKPICRGETTKLLYGALMKHTSKSKGEGTGCGLSGAEKQATSLRGPSAKAASLKMQRSLCRMRCIPLVSGLKKSSQMACISMQQQSTKLWDGTGKSTKRGM